MWSSMEGIVWQFPPWLSCPHQLTGRRASCLALPAWTCSSAWVGTSGGLQKSLRWNSFPDHLKTKFWWGLKGSTEQMAWTNPSHMLHCRGHHERQQGSTCSSVSIQDHEPTSFYSVVPEYSEKSTSCVVRDSKPSTSSPFCLDVQTSLDPAWAEEGAD